MQIRAIDVYRVDLVGRDGGQRLSGGRVYDRLDATIVRLGTDSDLVGWGESVPWGANYLPAFAGGVRAAIDRLAATVLGRDPLHVGPMCEAMDAALTGHGYAKHALEMACWDLLGKATGQPLHVLLGGMHSPAPPITAHVGAALDAKFERALARYREHGIVQFTAKAGGDPEADIAFVRGIGERLRPGESVKVDANGGWRVDEALRVARALAGVDVVFEQPCRSYEACRDLRRAIDIPVILDECVTGLDVLVRARADGVLDGVNLKIGRLGGLSAARRFRDACAELDVAMHVQCMGGSHVTSAAIAHLAHSTPGRVLVQVWDAMNLIETETADGAPVVERSRISAGPGPGLGVTPRPEVLGDPVARYA